MNEPTNHRIADVHDRLEETEHRFRTMADCAPVLLWMAGTDAMCEFFNQVWLDFTGRTMEQEVGIGWAEGIHPEDFQRSVDTYLAAFNERREFKMVYRLRRADGAYRFILDNGVPRNSPAGVFSGYIGSCVDITERVEAEQDKVRLVRELTETLRTREEFISIASHELKTPLTSLKLHVERLTSLLRRDELTQDERERAARTSEASVRQIARLERLVEHMLESSRDVHAGDALRRVATDLPALVAGVAERLVDALSAAGCSLEVVAPSSLVGAWDPDRIEQIVTNLLSNAMKYGAGEPICIEIRDSGDRAVFRVRDRGRGIALVDQTRIFERFERAVRYSEISGLGLGLYIAKMAAEAHGGSIRVESTPGAGAVFEVELPVA